MKPQTKNSPTTTSRVSRRGRPEDASDYVSLTETRKMLSSSAPRRLDRLMAGDMVGTDEAAEMTGTSRVTINAWINKGRAIGLTQTKRGFRLPRWQFDCPIWDALPALSKALGTHEGWALLTFLESPTEDLDGTTPREALERGEALKVVELAARGN